MIQSDESTVEDAGHKNPLLRPASEVQVGIVTNPLYQAAAQIAGVNEPTAPISIPSREELTVRLVNISQLQRLDELRGDTALLQSMLTTALGAMLGLVTTILTSNQAIDKSVWILLTGFIVIAMVFGYLTNRANKRAVALRRRLFDDGTL